MNYIKNSLKLLLLWLITPLLCGVSFGANFFDNTQFTSVYHSVCDKDTQNTSDCFFDAYYYSSNSSYNYKTFNNDWIYCLAITSNLTDNDVVNLNINNNLRLVFRYATYGYRGQYTSDTIYTAFWDYVGWKYLLRCSSSNKAWKNVDTLQLSLVNSSSNWISSLSSLYDNWIYFEINVWYVPFTWFNNLPNNWGGSSCDYSEYESTITTLSWNLATCNTNLNNCLNSNCDTQLSQCIIDRDNALSSITTLSWSLASCNEDKSSLQNYNNSLNSQLNQCLLWWSWENLSWSCIDYSLFWTDLDTNYSLPITNNLFLPNGYKWKYNEDNVLSIAKINTLETAYQFSDDDKITIIDLLSMVMLFLLATWSLIWIILFLKRLIIKK